MPLLFSHSSRLSVFRGSRWGAPVLPSSCCCWRSTTSQGLALFSHRSTSRIFIMQPDCSSPPVVTQNDDHQPCGGEERAGLWPPPCPQLQGCSSSVLGGWVSRVGVLSSAWAGDPLLPPAIGGEGRPPALRRRRTATCCLVGAWPTVRPPHGRRSRCAQVGHTHGPSRTAGLDGLVLTPAAGTGAKTSLCALGRPPFAGAALVRRWLLSSALRWWPPQVRLPTAEVVASADETVSATCGWTSGSLALMACSRPP
jgi:hypothetical protein